MEFGNFQTVGKVGILIEKERRGVQPVCSAMQVKVAVDRVGAGSGAHINVRAAGGTLLSVVHRGVDANLLNGFRGGSGKGLSDGEIGRCGALNHAAITAGSSTDARIVHNACGGHLAGALTIEQILGIHAIQQKGVAGIALSVGPDGLIAQAGVRARTGWELGAHSGRKNGQPGEATGWQWNGFELRFVENIAIRGVHGVEQRGFLDGDGRSDLADFQCGVQAYGAIGLNQDGGNFLSFETVVGESESVGADRQVHEFVRAAGIGLLRSSQRGLIADERHQRVRQHRAAGIGDRAGDSAQSLLRTRARRAGQSYASGQRQREDREPNSREHTFLRSMRTNLGTGMPSENSHGEFLRFTRNVAQILYFTPKMEGRYAFFVRERSIFNL